MLVAVSSTRKRMRSLKLNCLERPAWNTFAFGPSITPFDDVPKLPACGAANAVGSNHRSIVLCEAGRLGSRSMSGRLVTFAGVVLLVLLVPVGSGPVQSGVRN